MRTENFHRHILIGLALIWSSYCVKDLLVAAPKGIKIDVYFYIMIKERCKIQPVKKQNININE